MGTIGGDSWPHLAEALSRLPRIVPAVFRFRALGNVTSRRYFTGPSWYARFASALSLDPLDHSLKSDARFVIAPLDRGGACFEKDDEARILVTFTGETGPAALADALSKPASGDARPVVYTDAFALAGWEPTLHGASDSVRPEHLAPTVRALTASDRTLVRFDTPLLLKAFDSPGSTRSEDVWVQPDSLTLDRLLWACWARLCDLTGIHPGNRPMENASPFPSTRLVWIEVPYEHGTAVGNGFGGIMGEITIDRSLSEDEATLLAWGARLQIGKQTSFGLGRLRLPELENIGPLPNPRPAGTLLERLACVDRLQNAVTALYSARTERRSSPDVTAADLRRAGKNWLGRLAVDLREGSYRPGKLKPVPIERPDDPSRKRWLAIPSPLDRLVQRAVADMLIQPFDALMDAASFAYRPGLNRQRAAAAVRAALADGYTNAVRADIAAFFDRVPWDLIRNRLVALLGDDPLVELLMSWVRAPLAGSGTPSRTQGLPQGAVVSPLLSNLALDAFDRDIRAAGFRLVRYADDFVILARPEQSQDQVLARVRESLANLGLTLNEVKTRQVNPMEGFDFLGLRVVAPDLEPAVETTDGDPALPEWPALVEDADASRRTAYVSGRVRVARVENDGLVLADGERRVVQRYKWSDLARIVLVGRVGASGSVAQSALRHGVPILFLNHFGRALGELVPAATPVPSLAAAQRDLLADPDRVLRFCRAIVEARLRNTATLLRRNGRDPADVLSCAEKATQADSIESLLGFEGSGGRAYWEHWRDLAKPFDFPGRRRRPPPDPVNAMLSLLYTLLYNRMSAVLVAHGFDVRMGFYHQGHGAHAALASDLMEELRHIVEMTVLKLIHNGQVQPAQFEAAKRADGACYLPPPVFRAVLLEFEDAMRRKFTPMGLSAISYNDYLDELSDDLRAALLLGQDRQPLRIR
jgi:group II intron reverse transcriptase/maturase/CRISPR-associated endonuclease Cas1